MKMTKNEGPLATAVRLLARRDHSEYELRIKLKQRGFSMTEIDMALERIKIEGYLDDERLKIRLIEKLIREQRAGLHVIIGKLGMMGLSVSTETVREYLSVEAEWELAQNLLEKQRVDFDSENYPRLVRILNNRGFSRPILSRLAEKCLKHQ
jgi:regulatory protein